METKNTTPQYYYEWGNEKAGYVSTYRVENGVVVSCEDIPREKATELGLSFDCPFP